MSTRKKYVVFHEGSEGDQVGEVSFTTLTRAKTFALAYAKDNDVYLRILDDQDFCRHAQVTDGKWIETPTLANIPADNSSPAQRAEALKLAGVGIAEVVEVEEAVESVIEVAEPEPVREIDEWETEGQVVEIVDTSAEDDKAAIALQEAIAKAQAAVDAQLALDAQTALEEAEMAAEHKKEAEVVGKKTKAEAGGALKMPCPLCGKMSVGKFGIGSLCAERILEATGADVNDDLFTLDVLPGIIADTKAYLIEHYPGQADKVYASAQELADELEADVVPLSKIDKLCKANAIPISKFKKGFGGDRGLEPAVNPRWTPYYVKGRGRYLRAEVAHHLHELLGPDAPTIKLSAATAKAIADTATHPRK